MEPIKNSSTAQASGRGRGKGFTIPSLSEIKKASKVAVISSSPILFNKTQRTEPQANLTTLESSPPSPSPSPPHIPTVGSSHTSTIIQSGGPTCSTDALSSGKHSVTNDVLNGERSISSMTGSRKRAREIEVNSDKERSKKLPPTIDERDSLDNDDLAVVSNPEQSSIYVPVSSSRMDPDSSVSASVGLASTATTSTIIATVHHPHAIIANIVQVYELL